MKSVSKSNKGKKIEVSKRGSARQAIGKIKKDTDTFIFTFGQFSLIDALAEILIQTGPAHVVISTWTAAHAHIERSSEMMVALDILSLKMIVDRSFRTRQPAYFNHMLEIFGSDSIREIPTHAKYMVIHNDEWDIVVRTSMNLNENPRLENIEISESSVFARFFREVTDNIFKEAPQGVSTSALPDLRDINETNEYALVESQHIKLSDLKEASYTHELKKH